MPTKSNNAHLGKFKAKGTIILFNQANFLTLSSTQNYDRIVIHTSDIEYTDTAKTMAIKVHTIHFLFHF